MKSSTPSDDSLCTETLEEKLKENYVNSKAVIYLGFTLNNCSRRLHIQVRLMSDFGLNGGIPLAQNTDGVICFICNEDIESVAHFFLDCSYFRNNFDSLWNKLKLKMSESSQTDGVHICGFITNLDGHNKVLLLLGGLALPFNNETNIRGGQFQYKPIRDVPFFRVSFFSVNSWTGYENWSEIPKRVMTICSRTKGYCFQEQ